MDESDPAPPRNLEPVRPWRRRSDAGPTGESAPAPDGPPRSLSPTRPWRDATRPDPPPAAGRARERAAEAEARRHEAEARRHEAEARRREAEQRLAGAEAALDQARAESARIAQELAQLRRAGPAGLSDALARGDELERTLGQAVDMLEAERSRALADQRAMTARLAEEIALRERLEVQLDELAATAHRRIGSAEQRAADADQRAADAEKRATAAEQQAAAAEHRAAEAERRAEAIRTEVLEELAAERRRMRAESG
jgi:hypothetical protein